MNKTVSELIHAGFISEKQLDLAKEAFRSRIADPSVLSMRLGCLLKTPSKWDLRGEKKGTETLPDVLYSGNHPGSVSLSDRVGPVADQQDRFASPAAAVTALLEFICSGGKERLSAAFLYRKCKEIDHIPAAGTLLETAFECAEKFGVCREELMGADPEDGPDDAVLKKRDADAARHRLSSSYRKLERFDDIDMFKDVLSGGGSREPLPIVVGIDVFKSWFCSPFTQKSGWLSLPLPCDERLGGTAMLITGYRDSRYVAGGGYFIAKNSWGTDWAAESDCPGYAKIPYAYIVDYVRFAGTAAPGGNAAAAPGTAEKQPKKDDPPHETGKKAARETKREDFISDEQYEEAVKAVTRDDGDYAPGGKTGCILDEDRQSPKFHPRYSGYSKGGNYPAETSLVPFMPPVYDQGGRGTCAAMAITALAEYCEGCREKLSPQYLYCKCKEFEYKAFQSELAHLLKDSSPGELYARLEGVLETFALRGAPEDAVAEIRENVASVLKQSGNEGRGELFALLMTSYIQLDRGGTTLDVAMRCLEEDGICAYDVWPYQKEAISGNEGQFVDYPDTCAPEDSEADARKHRLRDGFKMIYPPNSVEAYKAVLSGANGNQPMPVAIGAQVFASWTNSPFAKKTGWISLPLATDKNMGGHAMLVVGYRDSSKVPGGGYFIVRNSWGTSWSFDAPDPGYARMPYRYVEQFVAQAATIIRKKEDAPASGRGELSPENAIEKYVSVAAHDMKDGKGIWSISKGSWIISDPVTGAAEPDTPENRSLFVKNGFSWQKEAASRRERKVDADPALDAAIGIMNAFAANLDANLRNFSRTYCFPGINLPLSARLMPWQIRVRKVDLREDISEQWVTAQIDEGLLAKEDEEEAKLCNRFLVYELRNGSVVFRVAAIFLTAVAGGKLVGRIDNRLVTCAEKLMKKYQDTCCRFAPASATFCVLGTSGEFSEQVKAGISHDTIEILAQKTSAEFSWDIRVPEVKANYVWYYFISHLLPMTPEEKLDCVRGALERVDLVTMGHIDPKKIAADLGWPLPLVLLDLDELCRLGECQYRSGGIVVSKEKRPGRGFLVFTRLAVCNYYDAFVSAVFFAAGWKIFVKPDMSNRYQISTIAGLALFSYLGSLLHSGNLRKVTNNNRR